ncbi:MAG: rod shape-determining protein MreC [Limnohabitans sp.]|jgi:rod shape-determining protein MreC|nr:MAG: rod shape-determining protein MreC [Limnohabitans sp.]
MALDSLDRSPPPFFRQGLPALSKLVLLGLLSLLLMSADHRLGLSRPIRSAISVALAPMQWLALLPQRAGAALQDYFTGVDEARDAAQQYHTRTIAQAQRLQQAEQLLQENKHLRELLELRNDHTGSAKAVQVLYETADPYSRSIVIDKGALSGIVLGSAVVDVAGVVGQVTRVYPLSSEVTLLTDRDQSIPVLNARTGHRFIAAGDPVTLGGSLELRFVPASADLQDGDLLTTSGIDGVYPAGLQVGRIRQIDRRIDNAFAKVHATPMAQARGRHMLVLPPVSDWPERPVKTEPASRKTKGKSAAAPAKAAASEGGTP